MDRRSQPRVGIGRTTYLKPGMIKSCERVEDMEREIGGTTPAPLQSKVFGILSWGESHSGTRHCELDERGQQREG